VPDPTFSAFLEACGSIGPLRLSLKGPETARAVCRVFHQPFAVIGRAPGADLTLDHPAVSRRHAYIQLMDGLLFGVDLSSRTGTYWQDEARPMGWLGPGHSLRVGPYRIGRWGETSSSGDADEEPPSPVSRLYEPSDLVAGTLEFLDPSVEPGTWSINQALVLLGRSPACKIQLAGAGVSKHHASLVRTPQGIWLIDLLGRGGVLVNGAAARCVRLDDGDIFQIGPHRIRLWYAPAPDRPPPRPSFLPAWPEPEPAPHANGPLATIEPAQVVALREAPAEAVLVPLVRELGQMQQQMADQFQHALLKMFEMFSGMHQEQMGLIRQQLDELTRLSQEQQALQEALARQSAASPVPRPAAGSIPPAPYRRDADRPPRPEPQLAPRPRLESARDDIHGDLVNRLAAIQQERESRWQKLIRSVLGGER
jgi:pSer/pThr/pTyr-binding forkhead associated (FHA) protein